MGEKDAGGSSEKKKINNGGQKKVRFVPTDLLERNSNTYLLDFRWKRRGKDKYVIIHVSSNGDGYD